MIIDLVSALDARLKVQALQLLAQATRRYSHAALVRRAERRQLDTDTLPLDPFRAPKPHNGSTALCPECPSWRCRRPTSSSFEDAGAYLETARLCLPIRYDSLSRTSKHDSKRFNSHQLSPWKRNSPYENGKVTVSDSVKPFWLHSPLGAEDKSRKVSTGATF